MCTGIWWFYLFWLPDYLHKQFGMTGGQVTLPTFTVYGVAIVGSVNYIQPGNYSISSLTVAGSGQIKVASDVTTAQPVRFFVNDGGYSQDAISVGGSGSH